MPRRLVLAGMGLEGIVAADERTDYFLRVIENRRTAAAGTPEWLAAQFLRTSGVDAGAAVHVLRSQVSTRREELGALVMPILVASGIDDHDNGSSRALTGGLPDAHHAVRAGMRRRPASLLRTGPAVGAATGGPRHGRGFPPAPLLDVVQDTGGAI